MSEAAIKAAVAWLNGRCPGGRGHLGGRVAAGFQPWRPRDCYACLVTRFAEFESRASRLEHERDEARESYRVAELNRARGGGL
jgi:hypothetical protein